MESNIGWDVVANSSNKKFNTSEFLRVKQDCKLKIRLLGNPIRVVKIFTEDRKCLVLDNEEVGRKLKEKYADQLGNVSVRYACWSIDRDDNSLKILDMPRSVARAFGNRASLLGKKISGAKEGCDWAVVTNGKRGKDVRYEVFYIEETPLTEAEKKMVENRKESDGHFDLTKIFKSYSFDEAEERLLEGK